MENDDDFSHLDETDDRQFMTEEMQWFEDDFWQRNSDLSSMITDYFSEPE